MLAQGCLVLVSSGGGGGTETCILSIQLVMSLGSIDRPHYMNVHDDRRQHLQWDLGLVRKLVRCCTEKIFFV